MVPSFRVELKFGLLIEDLALSQNLLVRFVGALIELVSSILVANL